jgi:hypothetical protein
MQLGIPVVGDGEHAVARSGSHVISQPPQFMKDGWLRPSVPEGTIRPTQVVSQHRSVELHDGRQLPSGIPESGRTTMLASVAIPASVPGAITQVPPLQRGLTAGHASPHEPQLSGSLDKSRHTGTSAEPQHVNPEGHIGSHANDVSRSFAHPRIKTNAPVVSAKARRPSPENVI